MKLSVLLVLLISILLCQSLDHSFDLQNTVYSVQEQMKRNPKIIFIVDTSASVSVANFKTMQEVLNEVVYQFPEEDEYRYALYSFSEDFRAHTENSWKKLTGLNFREDVTKIQHIKLNANLGKVLRHIHDGTNLLEQEGATTFILIDGVLNDEDETIKELLRMQEKGAKTTVFAFGDFNEEFLAKVPGQYIHVQNPADILGMLKNLKTDFIKADISIAIQPQKVDNFKISDPLEVIVKIENKDDKGRIIKNTTKIQLEALKFTTFDQEFFLADQKIRLDRNIEPGQSHSQTLSLRLNGGNLNLNELPETFKVQLYTEPRDPIILPISNFEFRTNTSK